MPKPDDSVVVKDKSSKVEDRLILPKRLQKPDELLNEGEKIEKDLACGKINRDSIPMNSPYWEHIRSL
jgi:hypothetical protein